MRHDAESVHNYKHIDNSMLLHVYVRHRIYDSEDAYNVYNVAHTTIRLVEYKIIAAINICAFAISEWSHKIK